MRDNILGIFFSVLSGVLVFLSIFAYTRSDRVAPEFRFSAVDLVYDSEIRDNDLIVGINAYDAKDGDVSGRIVVEKVVLNREKETAVVYYAVADQSGNVTKQSRVFPADIADIDNNGDSSEIMEDELLDEAQAEAQTLPAAVESPAEAEGEAAGEPSQEQSENADQSSGN